MKIFLMILAVLAGLLMINSLVEWSNKQGDVRVGLTYSSKYAQQFHLDPRQTYLEMLDDLQVKYLRLPVYWDEVEKYRGVYNFSETDWYLSEAQKRGVEVNLVLGYKQPRWPECYAPEWAYKLPLDQFNQSVMALVSAEVEHFKQYPNIRRWQVENEPNLPFGYCNKPDPSRLAKEVAVVRGKDSREIAITESGELNDWTSSMRRADHLGISIYRTVWNPWIGLVDYPLPPTFYSLKNLWSSLLSGKNVNRTFVAELQAEAWGNNGLGLEDIKTAESRKLFPPEKILVNFDYARRTGIKEIYLWGGEWWYHLKNSGDNSYLDNAKKIFKGRVGE